MYVFNSINYFWYKTLNLKISWKMDYMRLGAIWNKIHKQAIRIIYINSDR